ncbi:hypothetical protein DPMN_168727 [Dreissena polymorpha]|uniref:Uncharacterized protein n=1 Tax=Dreissena polymorpha TaxID=45954 RepID=A0A9D4F181_DREPO|nr:hypothetical protein DPMN_168727 [Dreissena polymorpha]
MSWHHCLQGNEAIYAMAPLPTRTKKASVLFDGKYEPSEPPQPSEPPKPSEPPEPSEPSDDSEDDEKEIDKVMDDDMSLCERATRYVSLLEQLHTNIVSQLASKKDTEEKVLPAQEELKTFILEQSLGQREFTERQSAQQQK